MYCNEFCEKCLFVCHRHREVRALWSGVGGFEKPVVGEGKKIGFKIPGFFPTVWKSKVLGKTEGLKVVALNVGRIFNPASGTFRSYDVRDLLGLPLGVKVVLTFHVKDNLLNYFWKNLSSQTMFIARLKKLRVDLICSPNFSNYFESPKMGYFYNVKRSMHCARVFSDLGFAVAKDISSPCSSTDKYYLELLKDVPQFLSFNCQLTKLERFKKIAFERFAFFHKNLPEETGFIITGFTGPRDALRVYEAAPGRDLHFTSSSIFMRALCRQAMEKREYMANEPEDLFRAYIIYQNQMHTALRMSVKQKEDYHEIFQKLCASESPEEIS